MKTILLGLASILALSACQKELSSTTTPVTIDTTHTWKLTGYRFQYYDTIYGGLNDSGQVKIVYNNTTNQTFIYKVKPLDTTELAVYNYTLSGLLTRFSYHESSNTSPTVVLNMDFIRNSSNVLQQLNYINDVGHLPGTGYFFNSSNAQGKVITYIDTLPGVEDPDRYQVQFNSQDMPISMTHIPRLTTYPITYWGAYAGTQTYFYDAYKNLTRLIKYASDSYNNQIDSTIITYTRDQSANNLLFDFFNSLYGNDLTFWFNKSDHFYGNMLSGTEYYNFGKPCTSITYVHKRYINGILTLNDIGVFTYQNRYDSNGNLVSYSEIDNGRVAEKWWFTYTKL